MKPLVNSPNAGRLMLALRSTGYDIEQAVSDLIDNALDAEASEISISVVEGETGVEMAIVDNGTGMDEKTLIEAMRLGSITERDTSVDLGKFGMGLITASMAIGRRLCVTSRKDGVTTSIEQDLDEIIKANDFIQTLLKDCLDDEAENSYTEVRISKIDVLEKRDIDEVVGRLRKYLARVFRTFTEGPVTIYLNGEKIQPLDYLCLNDKESKTVLDERHAVEISGIKDLIRVRIVLAPPYSKDTWKSLGTSVNDVGFSIIRNGREIANGKTLGMFTKHPKYLRMRAEIHFPATLDAPMGVSFTKHDVRPTIALRQKIEQIAASSIRHIVRTVESNWASSKGNEVKHDTAEKVIQQKAKQLITPEGFKERRKKGDKEATKKPENEKQKRKTGEREPAKRQKALADRVRFENVPMSRTGPLFETYADGKCVVVQINTDHPFFEEMYLKDPEVALTRDAIDYLLYSMASAELSIRNSDTDDVLDNQKMILSGNLRSLLS